MEPPRSIPARVSVIVPTHDRPEWLRGALASIRALDGPDLELDIIVADDASGAGTDSIAREFQARVVRPAGSGAAASRNAGLRATEGEFIAFLDDDDVWLPQHLRPHLALMRANPGIDAVASQVRNGNPTLTSFGDPWPRHVPEGVDVFRAFYRYFPQIGAMVARQAVINSVGLQDESLQGSEDWDWQLRLALRHRVAFIPVPSVGYRTRRPGADDQLTVLRVREHRRVFWANARRAGRRCPSPGALLGAWSKHRGEFASYLIDSADAHVVAGDARGARRAVWLAFRVSPPHCVKLVLTTPRLRRLFSLPTLAADRPQA